MKSKISFLLFLALNFHFLNAQKPELVLPIGHTETINSAEFSQNREYIVTASDDNSAKLWDAESGKLLRTFTGHTDHVISAKWGPNDKRFVTMSLDKTARIWDIETGELLQTFEHNKTMLSAEFSSDGSRILVVSDNDKFYLGEETVYIWNTITGKLMHTFEGLSNPASYRTDSRRIVSTFSPDSKKVVTTHKHTARIWDTETGKLLISLEGHSSKVISVAFSTNGRKIITMCLGDQEYITKIWDTKTGNLIKSIRGTLENQSRYFVQSAKFINNSRRIIILTDYGFTTRNEETGKIESNFHLNEMIHWHEIRHTKLSPDGEKVLIINGGSALIFSIETGELLITIEAFDSYIGCSAVTFSSDSEKIVIAYGNTASIFNIKTGDFLQDISGSIKSIRKTEYSYDGKITILPGWGNNGIKILDIKTGKLLHYIEENSEVSFVESSIDGDIVATKISLSDTVNVWNTKKENAILLHTIKDADRFSISPDGNKLFISYNDDSGKIWDVKTGELLLSLEGPCSIYSANFSYDGKKVFTKSSKAAKTWDATTGKLLHEVKGINGVIVLIEFSSNGKILVTKNQWGEAAIWDTENKMLLQTMENVEWFNLNPDGNKLFMSYKDKASEIWNIETGKKILTFKADGLDLYSGLFSFDSKSIITKSGHWDTAIVWDVLSGNLLKTFTSNGKFVNTSFRDNILISKTNSSLILQKLSTGEKILQYTPVDSIDWIVLHPSGLFDASTSAMEKMYYVQGLEIIELNQLKDRYWEPDLWKKVLADEELRDVETFGESLPLFPKVENLVIKKESIEFDLLDQGGGIGKYFIFINDKEAYVGNDLNNEEVYMDSILHVNFNFENHEYLLPGDSNKITVKAYNAENYIISRGANVLYSNTRKKEIVQPNIFIVSCGVSDYTGNQIDLRYAAKDAEDISHSLQLGAEQLFGTEKTFQYLLSTNGEKENWPTKENIENTFVDISKKAKSTDIIVVYLSGHGINWGGQDGDFYYLTQDAYTASGDAYNDPAIRKASTISSNELVELFKLVPANKQVLIIDACASGQVVEDLLAQRDISSSTIRALDRMKDRTGMYIITGSAADAVSYEASKYGQGLLTYSLLEGIKGAALREGQFIDVDILFQRAKDRVPQLAEGIGGIQEPQVFFPYGSSSFDIGLLNNDDKAKVPLAKEKPVFVMSTFMDADSFDDILGLENLIDEELRTVSAKGSEASLIFFETKKFPDAYRLRGQYSISGNKIVLNLNIFYGIEKIKALEIKGDKINIEGFVDNILEEIRLAILN